MDQAQTHDEDNVLDAQRESLHRSIERGEAVNWNEDDKAFLRLAEKTIGSDEDNSVDDDSTIHDDEPGTESGADDTEYDDEREALEQYLPDDIQNDPRPREERD